MRPFNFALAEPLADEADRPELHIDFETRSTLDLKKVGVHVYARHPSTDIICAAWTLVEPDGTESEGIWFRDESAERLCWIMGRRPKLFAHNAGFEHELWTWVLEPRYGVPAPADFDEWTCTAAMAAALAFPRDLGRAAGAVGLPIAKDDAGRRLMLQMCRPRSKPGEPVTWWETPEKLERLGQYCTTDVRVEHALAKRLRPLSAFERVIWRLDHEINSRGVKVDLEAVDNARSIALAEGARLNRELGIVTRHKVSSAKDHRGLASWLRDQGLDVDSVDKRAVAGLLAGNLSEDVRSALDIRKEAGRTSLAKLEAFQLRTCSDGRARGTVMYHGASTGRWTASGIQLQNLMRPWMKYPSILAAMNTLFLRDPAFLELWGSPTDVLANMMRSFIIAEDGHELVMADFANIEGRVLAWLAGEEWKLQAFRDYDAGTGPDLYVKAVAAMLGIREEDVTEALRQIGKVVELSLGYQGGHGAFLAMAANYGLNAAEVAPIIKAATDPDVWANAADGYDPDNRFELDELTWTALRVTVDAWRAAHPAIADKETGLWTRLNNAAMSAIRDPGVAYEAGRVSFACSGTMLWCKLPSGRLLSYPDPKLRMVPTPWGGEQLAVTYMAMNGLNNQWERHHAFPGLWAENITQAVARDLMACAMIRVEKHGWPVVLTVHDEIVAEVLKGSVSGDRFGEVMAEEEPWAAGLPVSAKGQISARYRK